MIVNYIEVFKFNFKKVLIYYKRGNFYYFYRFYEKVIKDYIVGIKIKVNYEDVYY